MGIADIVTPEFLRKNYLFGVNLTDDKGNDYPDSLFASAIDGAIAMLEAELSICLHNRHVRRERHDVRSWEGDTYYLFNLDKRPVVKVDELAIRFAAFEPSILPASWAHVSSPTHGQIQVMPGPEGLEGFSFSGGVPILGIDVLVPREYTPRWFQISYEAGFETKPTGTATITAGTRSVIGTNTLWKTGYELPSEGNLPGQSIPERSFIKIAGQTRRVVEIRSDTELHVDAPWKTAGTDEELTILGYDHAIIDIVALVASMLPLDTAGDLILGAGIANLSISMDGISQSVGTTSSATNSGYGARIIQYRDRIRKELLPAIKRKYKTIRVIAI